MNAERVRIEANYAAALAGHLDGAGEVSLGRAYEVGREAVATGLGILDILEIHEAALANRDASRTDQRSASAFRLEVLAAFEIAFRGYREANLQLRALNQTLLRQGAELVVANQELDSFSYSVSHDLRAPLRSIDGFTQAALEDGGDDLEPVVRDHLHRVRRSAQRMGELLESMLSLARAARGGLNVVKFDLTALAHDVTNELRESATFRASQIPDTVICNGMSAVGDTRLVRIVLVNLLQNAWKFSTGAAQPKVTVGSSEFHGEPAFFVQDNGVGFDMQHRDQLFLPFRRLHPAGAFEGTGIGLATVQRVIHRHRGRVWAVGDLDQGATFYFTLPGASTD